MRAELISKKILLIIICYSIAFFGFVAFRYFSDNETKIVFCDVKEGDATYIRLPNKTDIVIDAGASSLVTNCLGTHMPFYDKTIEYAFLTHVKKSQYEGYHHLLKRYSISNFIVSTKYSPTNRYVELVDKLNAGATRFYHPAAGEIIKIPDGYFRVIYPVLVPNGTNRPTKKHSYTFEFLSKDTSILHVGFVPERASLEQLNLDPAQYKLIKIAEYGFNISLLGKLTSLAGDAHFLLNVPENKADDLRTEAFSNKSFRLINGHRDAVYTF